MKNLFLILGWRFFRKSYSFFAHCFSYSMAKKLGGANKIIQFPSKISGIDNIISGNNVNIGPGSVIMTTRAKLIIKGHFVAGPNLTIITGDHMPIIGQFIDTVTALDKDDYDTSKEYDKDVIIDEDVWCGANVTVLKGVHIGRGCIIAAGAVVTHDIQPYSVAGGIPAKVIKTRWNKSQILEHEAKLYPIQERYTEEQIDTFQHSIKDECIRLFGERQNKV